MFFRGEQALPPSDASMDPLPPVIVPSNPFLPYRGDFYPSVNFGLKCGKYRSAAPPPILLLGPFPLLLINV